MNILLTTAVMIAATSAPADMFKTEAIATTIECPAERRAEDITCFQVGSQTFSAGSDVDWYADRERITVEFSWCGRPGGYDLCGIDIIASEKTCAEMQPK